MMPYSNFGHADRSKDRVQTALRTAKAFAEKAESLAKRFASIETKFGLAYPVGKIIRQSADAEQRQEDTDAKERNELLNTLEGLLERFDRSISTTERRAVSAREQTPDDDPVAKELDALRADIRALQKDSDAWRRGETSALGVGPESVQEPTAFEENRVDGVQRFLDAVSRLLGNDDTNAVTTPAPISSVFSSVRPALERRQPAPRTSEEEQNPTRPPVAGPGIQTIDEQRAINEPWPRTREEFRQQFRYSAERFGSTEQYARYVAVRLDSPQRINEFLENMFVYTTSRDTGSSQRMLNNGPGHREPNERWINPLEFLTTPNAQGELCGDCDDVALLFAYIAQLQGKQGFAFETSTSRYVSEHRIEGNGHAMAAWFENDGSLRIVDTTGIRGRTNATIQIVERRTGETDEQLLERGYRESRVNATPLDPRSLYTVISLRNGDGVNLPGNLSLCKRHAELQPLLESSDYRGALRIVEEEIARDAGNLNLRLAKIQLLLLANAPRSEVTAVTNNLSGVTTHTSYNMYAVQMTRRALLQQSPQYVEEAAALTRHCNDGRHAIA